VKVSKRCFEREKDMSWLEKGDRKELIIWRYCKGDLGRRRNEIGGDRDE
jgi:hypothetical protein